MDLKFSNILSRYLFLNSFKIFWSLVLSYSEIKSVSKQEGILILTVSDLEEAIRTECIEDDKFKGLKYELFLLGVLAGENQSVITAIKQVFEIDALVRGKEKALYSEYTRILKLIQLRFRKLSQGWHLLKYIAIEAYARLSKKESS